MTSVGTAGLRVGYAQNKWLHYATGGAAVFGVKANLTTVSEPLACNGPGAPLCSGTDLRLGGVAGLGVEYGFAPNWSIIKAEYDHIVAASFELSHLHEVRAGLNYRFGGF
jgi:outer membrane immunogenic protein